MLGVRVSVIVLLVFVEVSEFSITFPNSGEAFRGNSESKNVHQYVTNLGQATVTDLARSTQYNVIVSPLNIFICLAIAQLGARGNTKTELERVLGVNSGPALQSVVSSLQNVSTASAVFVDSSLLVKSQFVIDSSAYFQAPVFAVDFANGEESKLSINQWVSGHTNGTIQDLLQDPLDSNTQAIIASTVYFTELWQFPFPVSATKLGHFMVDSERLDVMLMTMSATLAVVRGATFTAVTLPYQSKGLAMHLVLPHAPGIAALRSVIAQLTPAGIRAMLRSSSLEQAIVTLPRTKVAGRYALKGTLQAQGIADMFSPVSADFGDLADETPGTKVYASQVYHSVYLELHEAGTVAAAAGADVLTKSGKFTFRATRPFIFFIRHDSGLVPFMGVVSRPQ